VLYGSTNKNAPLWFIEVRNAHQPPTLNSNLKHPDTT
jgi:hypothetical protein